MDASPISSVPANRAEPVTTADGGSRPITARQLTVLPDPDSPTMARVLPGQAVKLNGIDGIALTMGEVGFVAPWLAAWGPVLGFAAIAGMITFRVERI